MTTWADFDWGERGRGCSHCPTGEAMSWFGNRRRIVALCMECLMAWFPGRSASWIEERLDHYTDHVGFKLAKANPRGYEHPKSMNIADYSSQPVYDQETGRWSEPAGVRR